MRMIINKYEGECRKCGKVLEVGSTVVYEKRVGIFCRECGPTDPEEIRKYRQEAADRRADRLEGWAQKRRERAEAALKPFERYRGDIAFYTQPGHIPARARMIRTIEREAESVSKAREMEQKAESLRHVRVAGDAERNRQMMRDRVKDGLKVGDRVWSAVFGNGIVTKINKKTATIEDTGRPGVIHRRVDLSWIHKGTRE